MLYWRAWVTLTAYFCLTGAFTAVSGDFGETRLGSSYAPLSKDLSPSVWFMLSTFLFAVMLAVFKWLGQTVPVTQLILLRQAGVMLLLIPVLVSSGGTIVRTKALGLNVLRGLLSAAAMVAGFTAIVHLPLAEATTLAFTKVFFVVLLGAIVLKEYVSRARWGAMVFGFIGTIVVLDPNPTTLVDPMALLAVFTAFLAACTIIVLRKLAPIDKTSTLMIWQSAIVLLIVIGPGLADWHSPTLTEWTWIAILCGLMGAVQWTMIRAHRSAEASALSPIEYTRLIYAAAIGYLVFDDVPAGNTLIGAALIIAAAFWVQRAERIKGPPPEAVDPAERS